MSGANRLGLGSSGCLAVCAPSPLPTQTSWRYKYGGSYVGRTPYVPSASTECCSAAPLCGKWRTVNLPAITDTLICTILNYIQLRLPSIHDFSISGLILLTQHETLLRFRAARIPTCESGARQPIAPEKTEEKRQLSRANEIANLFICVNSKGYPSLCTFCRRRITQPWRISNNFQIAKCLKSEERYVIIGVCVLAVGVGVERT